MTPVFEVTATDGAARAGVLRTAHGEVRTPVFMPVGTKGTVKGVDPDELRALGAQLILGNTYHLHFRPGEDLIADLGGLHAFTGWDGPILTDSGGFQVFSLRHTIRRVDDDGVTFRSVYDGDLERFTPERAAAIQAALGADIAMCLDICPPAGVPRRELEEAVRRTTVWARGRARRRARRASSASGSPRARPTRSSAAARSTSSSRSASTATRSAGCPSGRTARVMFEATGEAAPLLPADRPRYFMGIGDPEGILAAIDAGIDMFDCVLPTRICAHRLGDHVGGAPEPEERALRRRPAPARRGLRLPRVPPLQPGLHPAPDQPGGAPRAAAAEPA